MTACGVSCFASLSYSVFFRTPKKLQKTALKASITTRLPPAARRRCRRARSSSCPSAPRGLTRKTTGITLSSPAASVWLEKQKQACFSMYLPAFAGAAFITACAVTGRPSVLTTR